jgi:hypothetical protein
MFAERSFNAPPRRIRRATLTGLILLAAVPASALAFAARADAVTLGSDLSVAPTQAWQADRNLAYGAEPNAAYSATAPADGTVTSFTLKRGATDPAPGSFQLTILTPDTNPAIAGDPCPPPNGVYYNVHRVGPLLPYTPNAAAGSETVNSINAPIKAGDRIGIYQAPPGMGSSSPAVSATRSGASMWEWFAAFIGPNGDGTGPHVNLCGPYANTELLLQVSVGPAAAGPHDSTTAVNCSPGAQTVGQPTTCTATVSDTASPATASAPGGTVTFGGSGGSFSSSTCALAAATNPSSCQVTYTPSAAGQHTIAASYGGDAQHNPSAGNGNVNGLASGGGGGSGGSSTQSFDPNNPRSSIGQGTSAWTNVGIVFSALYHNNNAFPVQATMTLSTAGAVTASASQAAAKHKHGKHAKKRVTLGMASFTIPAKSSVREKIHLSKQNQTLLVRLKSVTVVLTVILHDPNGHSATIKRTFTLKAPKHHKT